MTNNIQIRTTIIMTFLAHITLVRICPSFCCIICPARNDLILIFFSITLISNYVKTIEVTSSNLFCIFSLFVGVQQSIKDIPVSNQQRLCQRKYVRTYMQIFFFFYRVQNISCHRTEVYSLKEKTLITNKWVKYITSMIILLSMMYLLTRMTFLMKRTNSPWVRLNPSWL